MVCSLEDMNYRLIRHFGISNVWFMVSSYFVCAPQENKNLYAGYQSLTDIPKLAEIDEEYHDYAAEFKFVSTHEIVQVKCYS